MPFRRSPSELRWNSRGCGWRPAAHFAWIRVLSTGSDRARFQQLHGQTLSSTGCKGVCKCCISMASAHVSLACVQFRTSRPPGSRAAHRRGQFLPGPESPRHARVRNHSGHLAEKRSGDPVRVWGPGSSTVETAYSVAMWLYEHASNDFSPQMRRRLIPRFLHASGDRGYVLLVLSTLATSPLRLFSIVGEESRIVLRRPLSKRQLQEFPLMTHEPTQVVRRISAAACSPQELAERVLLEHFTPAYVVINAEGDVLHASVQADEYLELVLGPPTSNIFSMAPQRLRLALRACELAHNFPRHVAELLERDCSLTRIFVRSRSQIY
jgi:hypothetical protein